MLTLWSNLLWRGMQIDHLCPAYPSNIEDIKHIFAFCPSVTHAWQLAAQLPFDDPQATI